MTRVFTALSLVAVSLAVNADEQGYACLIEPYQKIEIRSPVEALITRILVDRGSVVKSGQVLVELDSSVEQAELAVAKHRATMDGPIHSAETRVNYAKEKLKRREELIQDKYISMQDRDDAFAELHVAEADLKEAKDNRQLAVLESRRLSEVVNERSLKSPFDGIVTERLQQPGELAQTGSDAHAILRMAQIDPLRVEVILPVDRYGSVESGMTGEVVPELPLKGNFTATVTVVDKVVDSASGTFGVRLQLPNPKGDIPAGVKCTVRFH
jgi:RND family efflux transporter MFP subunit